MEMFGFAQVGDVVLLTLILISTASLLCLHYAHGFLRLLLRLMVDQREKEPENPFPIRNVTRTLPRLKKRISHDPKRRDLSRGTLSHKK